MRSHSADSLLVGLLGTADFRERGLQAGSPLGFKTS